MSVNDQRKYKRQYNERSCRGLTPNSRQVEGAWRHILFLGYLILPYALLFYWCYWHFVLGPLHFFSPECVARVPVSLRGSGDWGCVCSMLHLRSQPSTIVRNRPREGHVAVPMVSSAEGIAFGGFKRLVASFRAAGVALRDVQTFFVTRPKSFCVASAILLRRFQKMRCSFRGRRNTLDVYIVILHGRRSTLDVLCRVFLRTALSGLRQAATKCRFRGRRGVLWDVMKIDGSLAQFWGCKFFRGKHRFWGNEVSKLDEVSHEMLDLLLLRVSSRVSGFPVASLCLTGGSFFEGFQAGCHVVLRGRRGTLWHSNRFYTVSKVSKLAEVSREMLVLLRLRVSSSVSGFPVASPCLWGKLQTTLYTSDSPLHTLHFALHILHSTLHTPHFTLYTLHPTLYTPPSTLYTSHFTLHTLHSTPYTPHFTLLSPHSTLHAPHYTLH